VTTLGDTLADRGRNTMAWRAIAALLDTPLLTPAADPDLWLTLNADPVGLSSGEAVLYDLACALLVGDTQAVLSAPLRALDEATRAAAEAVVHAWLGAA
jgi:hypothetical protein